MIATLQNMDSELDLLDVTIQDIVNSITLDDVRIFLESLGVDQIAMYEDKGYLICPTICHNPIDEEASMKLYWYQNNKVFRCYTECNEAMSIFGLYQKFMQLNYHPVSFGEAVEYIKKCIQHLVISEKTPCRYNDDLSKYQYDARLPQLPEYPREVLTCFIPKHHPAWLRDGIKPEVMDKFNIGFCIGQNKITIPHYDINGRLVGIRGRALRPEDLEAGQKYMPMHIGNTWYAHQLNFNLYGIYEHQNGIKKRRSAIIAEGEKSVLLDDGYYGDLSNTVACCGSHINKYQVNLLTNVLGANEIVIAFDKEYTDWRSDQAREYRRKIENMCRDEKYRGQAKFSYIWDMDNLLDEKDSPFDKGKEVFEKLYRNRIKIR